MPAYEYLCKDFNPIVQFKKRKKIIPNKSLQRKASTPPLLKRYEEID
jgi:hypothetical protein